MTTNDFNADNQSDILYNSAGENTVWMMDGNQPSHRMLLTPAADLTWSIAARATLTLMKMTFSGATVHR